MPAASQAAAMLTALSSPDRLALLSAIATRVAEGSDCSLEALSADLGMPMKTLVKEVARLQDCGLLVIAGRTVAADLDALRAMAGRLTGELPITGLLSTAPELERYFTHGRLTELTVDHSVKLKLAPLLARLLPEDRALTEAEVNTLLNQVHDDHAYLRRMLVDFGQLTRDGATNYRRAG